MIARAMSPAPRAHSARAIHVSLSMRRRMASPPRAITRKLFVSGFLKKHITNLTWRPSQASAEGQDLRVH